MGAATYHLSVGAARANALFASALQRSDEPSAAQVRQAIAATVRAFGTRGCAARVAQAYGEQHIRYSGLSDVRHNAQSHRVAAANPGLPDLSDDRCCRARR